MAKDMPLSLTHCFTEIMSKVKHLIMPSAIFAAGIVLAALGIWRGELRGILQKAVVVCLECIGIG